ncbi:hypothetical protein TNCV_4378181 [Trichonephila clavipes]|nr:hypothetical protein TNCV_4378181 [Trichonephila clavipes]
MSREFEVLVFFKDSYLNTLNLTKLKKPHYDTMWKFRVLSGILITRLWFRITRSIEVDACDCVIRSAPIAKPSNSDTEDDGKCTQYTASNGDTSAW